MKEQVVVDLDLYLKLKEFRAESSKNNCCRITYYTHSATEDYISTDKAVVELGEHIDKLKKDHKKYIEDITKEFRSMSVFEFWKWK